MKLEIEKNYEFRKRMRCIHKKDIRDFNDLIDRASKYGIDVYAYTYMESKMHPEDEGAEECSRNCV